LGFAWYIAMSARDISDSGVIACSGEQASPTLASTRISIPDRVNISRRDSRSCSAVCRA